MALLTRVSKLTFEYALAVGLAKGSQYHVDDDGAWLKATRGTVEKVQKFARDHPQEARDFCRRFRELGVSGPAIED